MSNKRKNSGSSSMRPGSDAAVKLFNESSIKWWNEAAGAYTVAVKAVAKQKKKPQLIQLDEWLWDTLPEIVKGRSPQHLLHSELSDIMRWKLIRGKMRPLQGLVDSNSPQSVIEASTKAIELLESEDWRGAINELCVLKGIGVATASVIVAALHPSHCAFMADEVIDATCPKRDYTLSIYTLMLDALSAKQRELSHQPGCSLSCERIGKALWTVATLSVLCADEYDKLVTDSTDAESVKRQRT